MRPLTPWEKFLDSLGDPNPQLYNPLQKKPGDFYEDYLIRSLQEVNFNQNGQVVSFTDYQLNSTTKLRCFPQGSKCELRLEMESHSSSEFIAQLNHPDGKIKLARPSLAPVFRRHQTISAILREQTTQGITHTPMEIWEFHNQENPKDYVTVELNPETSQIQIWRGNQP